MQEKAPVIVSCFLGATALLLGGVVLAETPDWRAWLQEERVSVEAGQLHYEEFSACQLHEGAPQPTLLQIHWRSSAPEALLTRDAFAMLTASMNTAIFHDMLRDARERWPAVDAPLTCQVRRALIGDPDLEIELVFAEGGIQTRIRITETGQVTRRTQEWADMFR